MFKKHKQEIYNLNKEIERLNSIISKQPPIAQAEVKLSELKEQIQIAQSEYETLSSNVACTKDKVMFYDYCVFEPKFTFKDTEEYKSAIQDNINKQQDFIKRHKDIMLPKYGAVAFESNDNFIPNPRDNSYYGYTLTELLGKNMSTTFNAYCNEIISNATPAKRTKCHKLINQKFFQLNNECRFIKVSLTLEMLDLKFEQLDLTLDHKLFEQAEKEEIRRQKEIIKEQKIVEKEIEAQKEKLLKERKQYEAKNDLENIKEIDEKINKVELRLKDQKFGYVYIINNPSLGQNVYKIGVTRRENPYVRIDELSGTSVPFAFSPNCIIFSEDCFALESALHREFAQYRVNKINSHKEYFRLNLEEIERIIKEKYCSNAQFNYEAIDENYLMSLNVDIETGEVLDEIN